MQTYNCLNCGYSFSEADKSWDVAAKSGQCPECLEPVRNSAFKNNRQGEKPPAQRPFQGNSILTQNGLPASPSVTTNWRQVSAEEAKSHPLYGVRGWLAFFAFSTLIGFAQTVTPVNVEAIKAGVSLGTLLSLDMPEALFLKWVLWIHGLIVVVIYGLLFSKHPSFRPVSTYLLLGFWPTVALAGSLNPFPTLGEGLVLSFIPWALYCATWVTYLQKSKRVRVTFEHRVKTRQDQDNGVDPCLLPSAPQTREALTDTPTIDTTPKKTNQRGDEPKPVMSRESVWDRQFSDGSPVIREQATPSGSSRAISSLQPTGNPIAPDPSPSQPGQEISESQEDRLYEQIAQELESNTVDKGLWTKAYAQAEGDDKQTRVLYIKARFARLLVMEDAQRDAIRREQQAQETARLGRAYTIQANLQNRMDEIERAGKSIELQNLAAGQAGSDFLYYCGLGMCFVSDVQKIFEANPFVLERTTSDGGYTGLHIAVRSKGKEMTHYLVEQGANIQARDSQGKTPLDIARETNQPEIVELLEWYTAEG